MYTVGVGLEKGQNEAFRGLCCGIRELSIMQSTPRPWYSKPCEKEIQGPGTQINLIVGNTGWKTWLGPALK